MKATLILFFITLNFQYCYSQNSGKIISESIRPKAGEINNYSYQPPEHLALPDKLFALIVYGAKEKYHCKKIPILRNSEKYQFTFKAPDSADVLIIGINDERNNPIDNNNELGFISWLYDKKAHISAAAGINAMSILSFYAISPLKLNYEKLRPVMIDLFEKAYKMSATLKREKPYYTYYLTLLYQENKELVKPRLLSYARQMASAARDEIQWMNAIKIYKLLELNDNWQRIEQKAIKINPDGKIAQNKFIHDFENKDGTESSILADIKEYIKRFKDSSAQMNYTFYTQLIGVLLITKKYNRLPLYEPLLHSKSALAKMYYQYAWQLSDGDQIDSSGSDLNFAKWLIKKNLDYVDEALKDTTNFEDDGALQLFYSRYAGTYAIILYKLKQFDSAFYYQDAIYKQGNNLEILGIERYILYAEKSKGAEFAYRIAVNQLLEGRSSQGIIAQLNVLSKKANIPESIYDSLKTKSVDLAAKVVSGKIKQLYGSVRGINFILKNLKGQTVNLATLKNKIVVLDFWATWCVPCRASFPAMKEIISRYKDDTDVVFLFIDTWEHKNLEQMQQHAITLMNEKGFDFQVLLDEKNKVADDYKVDKIPARFIINRRGNIVFMGESSNLTADIDNVKKINISSP